MGACKSLSGVPLMWDSRSFLMADGRFGPGLMLHQLLWGPHGQTGSGLVF